MVAKSVVINGITYVQKDSVKAVKRSTAKPKASTIEDLRASCKEWVTKHVTGNPTIVKEGLKIELPLKDGTKKVYDGVELSNKEIRVFVKGDTRLVKAWN